MAQNNPPIPNAYQVDLPQIGFDANRPAQLWAGEYPGSPDKAQLAERMGSFLDSGINHFINLTEMGERSDDYEEKLAKEAIKRDLVVSHQRFAVQDYSVPSAERLNQILDEIDITLSEGNQVYVHCWGGIGRTGTVIGCWLVRHGLTGQEALAKIAQWREGIPSAGHASPETAEQRQLILNWRGTNGS